MSAAARRRRPCRRWAPGAAEDPDLLTVTTKLWESDRTADGPPPSPLSVALRVMVKLPATSSPGAKVNVPVPSPLSLNVAKAGRPRSVVPPAVRTIGSPSGSIVWMGRVQHGAGVNGLVGDEGDLRRPVGVEDRDRHADGGAQRHARAVAVVGGGEGDDVVTRVGIARRPVKDRRGRVERRPGRQPADLIGDGRLGPVERGQGAIGGPVLGHESRVVGVEGEGPELEVLPLVRPASRPGSRTGAER